MNRNLTIEIPPTDKYGNCSSDCPVYYRDSSEGFATHVCVLDLAISFGFSLGPGPKCPQYKESVLVTIYIGDFHWKAFYQGCEYANQYSLNSNVESRCTSEFAIRKRLEQNAEETLRKHIPETTEIKFTYLY